MAALGLLGAVEFSGAGRIASAATKAVSPAAAKAGRRKLSENRVVLISDIHVKTGGHTAARLERVVGDILTMKPRPANVVIFGDIAELLGKKEDYVTAKGLLAPLEEAGIRVTIGMGNHDRRENYAEIFSEKAAASLLPDRYTYIVETPYADFIMLDSLQQGDDTTKWITPGTLDDNQREWLEKKLESYGKPVFVGSHHPISELKLTQLLAFSPYCCGYIHGHDHVWKENWGIGKWGRQEIIRTLCLPSTGYWGDIGYVVMDLEPHKAVATLHQYEFFFNMPDDEHHLPIWDDITADHDGLTCTFTY